MIIGEFTARAMLLLEKGPQDTIFLKTSNSRKIPINSYFAGRWK
jgi:hypothetical protein